MGRLSGKTCIVTGGAKGLGRVFATAFAGEGARVAVADIADGAALADEIGGLFIAADISDPEACARIAAETEDRLGPVDVLVNNAAVFATLPMLGYAAWRTEDWDRVLTVNVRGTAQMVQAVAPGMEARGRGSIINITSGTVYKGMPQMLPYIASKGAVAAMTRALSRELGGSGVRVNSLAPGLTLSSSLLENADHIAGARDRVIASRALKRDGHPEDLVGALLFLASDESLFMTGQTLAVDGGSVNT
ncbi:MAG: SDR family oxidoreductase [Maritimibacter sp.]|nr:SDR family oxidoreductase [Maritimibacter sp.]